MSDNHKIVQAEVVEIAKSDDMHPLVAAAIGKDGALSTEILEKVMELQERHEANQAKKEFNAALVKLKNELPTYIEHDKVVDFQGKRGRVHYTHTTLAKAVDAIVPNMQQFGFSHSWIPTNDERMVYVTCRLTHKGGHSEEAKLQSEPDMSGNKSASQGIASTITRLQRYTLLSLMGIATADMHEHDPREPHDPIDQDKNLEAIGILKREGIELSEAEKHLQKDFKNWTKSDLTELGKFIRGIRQQRETDAQERGE